MDAPTEAIRALVDAYGNLTLQNRVLVGASIVVGVLLVLAVLLSAYVVVRRVRGAMRARVRAERESRWAGITLEALTSERTIQEVVAQVGRREELPFLDFLLGYARRVRGEERDRIRSLAVPFLGALESGLRDRDPYVRARAVQILGTLGPGVRADDLVRAVDDESPLVAMPAARALARYGGAQYTAPVLRNLERFEPWKSEYVASLLVSLGPEAAPDLRGVLEDPSRSPGVRAVVVDALSRLDDTSSVPAATRALRSDPSPELATAALRMLAVLGRPEESNVVREQMDHPHFAVRAKAYTAYAAIAGHEGLERVERGLEDPSPWVVLHAARAMRDRGARLELSRLAESDHPGAPAAGQALAEG